MELLLSKMAKIRSNALPARSAGMRRTGRVRLSRRVPPGELRGDLRRLQAAAPHLRRQHGLPPGDTRPLPEKRHKSTYASATPATDGRIVVASFGSHGVHAYDLDGAFRWKVDVGRSMGELLMATPALSEGVMYVCSVSSLFAIGRPQ